MHCYLYYLQLMQVFIYSVNAFMHSSHAAGRRGEEQLMVSGVILKCMCIILMYVILIF